MAVFSIKDKNCDCIFDRIVELLKKEKNHVIKSEYAKIIKSLSISEKKIATILNEENICDVIVHLVDVKLNPMSISSKISIRHSDAKKNESFSNGYIIAFAPPNAFSFTNEISLYQNEMCSTNSIRMINSYQHTQKRLLMLLSNILRIIKMCSR